MPEITESHWEQICVETAARMRDYVKQYLSPISIAHSATHGEHLGSGAYCELEAKRYLITNEHVAKHCQSDRLAHQFFDSDCVAALQSSFVCHPYPVDVALSPISQQVWAVCKHKGKTILETQFDLQHDPVENELLFFMGSSGERSAFVFGQLFAPATPYLTQQCEFPTDKGDPRFQFALEYRPDLAASVDGSTRGLPDPHGFSGSLVWNTKRVERLRLSQPWTAEDARVTGIIWGWPSSNACVIATKVEHFRLTELVTKLRDA